MKDQLISLLAEWLRLSPEEATVRFAATHTAHLLDDDLSNLRFQSVGYVFSCLKQELEDEDQFDEDFERPEEMPEGNFVRSH